MINFELLAKSDLYVHHGKCIKNKVSKPTEFSPLDVITTMENGNIVVFQTKDNGIEISCPNERKEELMELIYSNKYLKGLFLDYKLNFYEELNNVCDTTFSFDYFTSIAKRKRKELLEGIEGASEEVKDMCKIILADIDEEINARAKLILKLAYNISNQPYIKEEPLTELKIKSAKELINKSYLYIKNGEIIKSRFIEKENVGISTLDKIGDKLLVAEYNNTLEIAFPRQ